jgi:hypothetical protein
MVKFIEKKRLLVFYCRALRILGWILLCIGIIGTALVFIEAAQTGGSVDLRDALGYIKRSNTVLISIALVSLGFAQLVRYLFLNDHKMGLLLRYGEKIFYLCAIIAVWNIGAYFWLVATGRTGGDNSFVSLWLLYFMPTILYKVAKILILIGLGRFLKQILVMAEEYRLKI